MHPGYFPVFFWSLLILVSFWGYGEILRRCINRPEFSDIGWGLTCAWGMSVVLALGGVMMALHLAKAPNVTALVLFGAAAAVFYLAEKITTKDPKSTKKKSREPKSSSAAFDFHLSAFSFPLLILCGLALLAFTTSIYWPNQFDPNDDWIAYLMFPEKILQTGTFLEPFSLRRVVALGGQSFLQAIVMVVGSPENGHILDRGFGAILLLGLMLKATCDVPKQWWFVRFLVIGLSLAASVPRIHTGSHLLGVVLLLALVMTVCRNLDLQKWHICHMAPIALVLAGVSTLRPIFAIVGSGMLVFFFLWRGVTAAPGKRVDAVYPLALSGILTLAFISPYMILSWQSSGTPMFPLSAGYANDQMMFGGTKEGGWTNWSAGLRFLCMPEIATMSVGLLLAALLMGQERILGVCAGLAGFGMVFLSAFKMSAADIYDVYRYTYPLLAFPLFWILARLAATPHKAYALHRLIPIVAGITVFLSAHFSSMRSDLQAQTASLPLQIRGFQFPVVQFQPSYKLLQSRVPSGEKIFAIVDAPFLLDYARNPIDTVDSIGGASLPPGMPFEMGSEALKDYFTSLGYRYLLCVDFDNAVLLYTRKLWRDRPRREWYFKEVWGRYALDFMVNMDRLADWQTIEKAGNVRLIKLSQ
ncbi:MAG: hypothetical protein ACOYNN_11030 [Terrimicrobiaceae bacterium]